jgi:hypothetical protein
MDTRKLVDSSYSDHIYPDEKLLLRIHQSLQNQLHGSGLLNKQKLEVYLMLKFRQELMRVHRNK